MAADNSDKNNQEDTSRKSTSDVLKEIQKIKSDANEIKRLSDQDIQAENARKDRKRKKVKKAKRIFWSIIISIIVLVIVGIFISFRYGLATNFLGRFFNNSLSNELTIPQAPSPNLDTLSSSAIQKSQEVQVQNFSLALEDTKGGWAGLLGYDSLILVITQISEDSTIEGYSIINTHERPIIGRCSKRAACYNFILSEPGDYQKDNSYNFNVDNDNNVIGTWKSSNGEYNLNFSLKKTNRIFPFEAIASKSRVYLYSAPDLTTKTTNLMTKGQKVQVLQSSNEFFFIKYINSGEANTGFVLQNDLKELTVDDK